MLTVGGTDTVSLNLFQGSVIDLDAEARLDLCQRDLLCPLVAMPFQCRAARDLTWCSAELMEGRACLHALARVGSRHSMTEGAALGA